MMQLSTASNIPSEEQTLTYANLMKAMSMLYVFELKQKYRQIDICKKMVKIEWNDQEQCDIAISYIEPEIKSLLRSLSKCSQ